MRRKELDVVTGAAGLVAVTIAGALIAGTGAYAAARWTIAGSLAARIQSVTMSHLVISAVVSPVATDVLYPGGNSDVVVTISNPNPYPVTVTAVNLPADTKYATGYTTSFLTTTKAGCLSTTPSDVAWNYSTSAKDSPHTLTKPLTVAARGQLNDPLLVTLIDDASMSAAAPTTCEGAYFSMPPLARVIATRRAAIATSSPTVDSWTS
jgi:hypothetical protein